MNPVNNNFVGNVAQGNNSFVGNVGKKLDKTFEVVAFSVNRSDALEKIAKITDRVIRFSEGVFGKLSTAMSNFGSQLRDTIIVFETLRFIGVMNILLTPNKEGKYFLSDPNNSWQKRTDRVTLAFHTAFKMVKGFNRFGFVQLGFMAKNVIGKLPIFTLAMDSFIIASSFFSTWDTLAYSLPKATTALANAKAKLEKWEYRPTAVAYLKINDEVELKAYETEYNLKAVKLHDSQVKLEKELRVNEGSLAKIGTGSTLSKAEQDKIAKECAVEGKKLSLLLGRVKVKVEKNDGRIAMIAERNCKGLAENLEKADANFKMKKWEVMKSNATQARTKVWFNLANSIGKIAVVAFALAVAATNTWAVAPIALSLLAMGIVVDSIGLTKILLTELWKPETLPKPTFKPRFEAIAV